MPEEETRFRRYGFTLSPKQQTQLSNLLAKFQGTISKTSGETQLVEMEIHMGDSPPSKVPSLRITPNYKGGVKEVDKLLELGIINPVLVLGNPLL